MQGIHIKYLCSCTCLVTQARLPSYGGEGTLPRSEFSYYFSFIDHIHNYPLIELLIKVIMIMKLYDMHKQVVMMKLKVDLNCSKCYKKVKKAIRKFPREFLSLI